MAGYRSREEALAAVGRPGWRVVAVEPQYTETTEKDPDTGNPIKTRKQTSSVWSIQSADGTQRDTMEVGDVDDPDARGGKAIAVLKGPGSNLPTPAAQPSPTTQLDKIDAQGNLIPPGASTPAAKLRDPKTGTTIDLPDPKKDAGGTLHEFGDQLLLVKPDGTFSVVTSKDPKATQQAKSIQDVGGAKYEYDPNKPEGQRLTKLLDAPPDKTAPSTKVVNGVTYQWNPSTNTWSEAQGLPPEKKPVAVYGTGANDKWRITIDDQGNVVSKEPNENYQEPKGTQLTPDTVSPNIPILKPDGTVQWVPNQNRVPAGQAMQDLLGQVGLKVNGGDLSMDDAKNMLTGAVNVMNAQTSQVNAQTAQTQAQTAQQTAATTAATTILENQRQGATTGAGLLQNRVTNAQGMLNSILGLAGQGQRSGNMGGGLMSVPAGLGQQLVGGIQGWTTELGGGQGVYDTAARLVSAADPQNGQSPEAHVAMGVLTQMLQKYQDTTGQPHPAVVATQAAQQSTAQNGLVAPVTTAARPATIAPPATPIVSSGTQGVGNPWAGGNTPPPGTVWQNPAFTAPVTVPLGV